MQAVALVTEDDFLVSYNLTIDTEDVRFLIKKLSYDWPNKFYASDAFFNDHYGINFAPIPAPSGICYNFNMIDAEDLYYDM
jgi:hypothetical protein